MRPGGFVVTLPYLEVSAIRVMRARNSSKVVTLPDLEVSAIDPDTKDTPWVGRNPSRSGSQCNQLQWSKGMAWVVTLPDLEVSAILVDLGMGSC